MKKNLEVIQEEVSDCGICSLASIIRYYGGNISLELLRYYTNTDKAGTNAYELINCAKRFGFDAYGEKKSLVEYINQPFIAHLKLENDFFHFVVIYKIKNNNVIMMDPSRGFVKMRLDEFYKLYTGVLLRLNPLGVIPYYKKSKFIQNIFFKEIKSNKKYYLILISLSFIILLLSIVNNFEVKFLESNLKYFYVLLLVFIVNELLVYFKNVTLLNNSIKFNYVVIKKFVVHIFKLPLNYLKLKQKGEISTRFNELNSLTNNIINFMIEIIYSIILCIISIFILFFLSFKLYILLVFMTLFYILFNYNFYKKIVNEIRYSVNLEESYNSNIIDYISNFDTIKHLNIYDYFVNNIIINLKNRNDIAKKLNKKVLKNTLINNILFNVIILSVLYFIFIESYDKSSSLVIYCLINFYIVNLKSIIENYPNYMFFKTFISKSNEFLSFNEYEPDLSKDNFDFISFKNLNYQINTNNIIDSLNYEIRNGDKIFISGPSGIGKSTLMKILNNEIKRYRGRVLIDNEDIRKYSVSNLITYVSQNEILFNDTIYNNLCLGKKIDEEIMYDILRICRLNDVNIIKINGLNSLIVNDNSLSGGERNRLILARTLIHSKKILILDEVLKEVEESLEIEIIEDLIKYFNDKTIIYISHKNVGYLFNNVLTFRKE